MIHEPNSRYFGLLSRRIRKNFLDRCIVQHIQILPSNSLLQVRIIARAAEEILVERGSALLDACTVALVVILDYRNVGRCASLHKCDTCFRDVALVCNLEGPVSVGFAVVCLVRIVEALGFVLRIEVGALAGERISTL
jgi:hypothetical protein